MAKKNRAQKAVGILAALIAVQALSAPLAHADGGITPQPPGYLIEIVRGFPISLVVPEINHAAADEVSFAVDGRTVQTDSFAPFGERISTRRFDHLGIATEVVHSFTATGIDLDGTRTTLAEYHLLIHPLPLIPRVHISPLVIKNQPKLVGFQLRGIAPGEQVKAWGRGFRHVSSRFPLPLVWDRGGSSSRTYVIPGGLEWTRSAHPNVTFSIGARPGEYQHGFSPRGRVYTGILKTNRAGDTTIHQTDRWKRCSSYLLFNERPPPRASCVYF